MTNNFTHITKDMLYLDTLLRRKQRLKVTISCLFIKEEFSEFHYAWYLTPRSPDFGAERKNSECTVLLGNAY